ncbi:OmpW/AlkL family protein [Rubrimonas cliftonensis]|uniref:Outer membrane protein n=1 Tax=Rubrimonas cliftonensis TaxID=89524 RepID=A0A1H3VS43_9RHOB|nr:OmpW family outer membrane protein [Rubrimonas cliftonensis]SDZ77589.1 outer membrane protein [Rubrimonas cliftonensis]
MNAIQRAAVAIAAMTLAAAPVAAQDGFFDAKRDGDFLVRLRGLAVIPNEELSTAAIPGADASISTAVVPELDFTYFFTDNIAAELILAVTPHDVRGRGALAGANLGDVWLLPPTLTLQYHVDQLGDWTGMESLAALKPYVGAGVNYTMFLGEDAGQFQKIRYDDAFGFALQAGLDYEIAEGVYLNADVKYIFLETDWTLDTGAGTVGGNVEINPLIIGLGVGYRF